MKMEQGESFSLAECFNEDDSLLCALDRIFDDALIFNLRGNSYRGKDCETFSLTTVNGKATNAALAAN